MPQNYFLIIYKFEIKKNLFGKQIHLFKHEKFCVFDVAFNFKLMFTFILL